MSNDWDVEQDEVMRYGADPDSCPLCGYLKRLCAFHLTIEKAKERIAEQEAERTN